MPTVPYVKALTSISGGAATAGFRTPVAASATVQLSLENSASLGSVRWEIYQYPKTFATPAGWTLLPNGLIVSTDTTPPLITLTTLWGKWLVRVIGNNGTKNGLAGDPDLIDETCGWEMLSPNGVREIGAGETTQVSVFRGWTDAEQDNSRKIETALTGGAAVPSGTGFRHVTAGVEDGAAALVVNADVNAAAAIAGTKIAPDFGSQTVQTTGKVLCGYLTGSTSTIPASGLIRTPLAIQSIIRGMDTGATERDILSLSPNSTTILLGHQTSWDLALYAASLQLWGYSIGNIFGGSGGSQVAQWTDTEWRTSVTMIGNFVPWGSVNGIGAQAMADANQTPASAVYKYTGIATTGALTANRNLQLPDATDPQGYAKWINNQCTGAFGVVCKTSAGTTVTVANGKSAWIWFDSRGATRMTADV